MDIRTVLLSCLTVFVLSGCTISVDEPSSKNDETPTENDLQKEDSQEDETNSKNALTQFIENFFEPAEEVSPNSSDETLKQLHYLALGDSLTDGVGDEYKRDGYVGRLGNNIENWDFISEVTIDNRGKNGRRSDQLLKLLEKGHYDREIQNAQLISLTMGGNDVMKVVKKDLFNLKRDAFNKELDSYENRYRKIVDEIREKNPTVPLVLIGFYNPFSIVTNEDNEFKDIIHEWNGVIEEVAKEDSNACYVNIEDLFNSNEELVYHTDFFHPNAKGYTKMTQRILKTMQQCDMERKIAHELGFKE